MSLWLHGVEPLAVLVTLLRNPMSLLRYDSWYPRLAPRGCTGTRTKAAEATPPR